MNNDCLLDNVVHSKNLRSINAAFIELEKSMYSVATPVLMFAIIFPGRYTHSKKINELSC